MGMGINSIGCCNCTPVCPPTLHLEARNTGGALSGGTITLSRSGGPALAFTSGTFNSSGDFTLPSSAGGGPITATVVYMGLTLVITGLADSTRNCGPKMLICYCAASVAITTMSGALVLVQTMPAVSMTLAGGTSPGGSAGNQSITAGSGTITASYAELILCTTASAFPISVTAISNPQTGPSTLAGYKDDCASVTLACGGAPTISLPLYYWPTCYVESICGGDPGCGSAVVSGTPNPPGTGNPGPSNRGLTPKNLQAQLALVTAGSPSRGLAPSGWVALTYLGQVTRPGTAGGTNQWSGGGIFITDCDLVVGNCCYVTWQYNAGGGGLITSGNTSGSSGGISSLVSPVDVSILSNFANDGSVWRIEIREVPCASEPPGPGGGGTT